jgi:hypothetical protein
MLKGALLVNMRPTDYPETSVNDYKSKPRNISEERRPNLHRGGRLKARREETPWRSLDQDGRIIVKGILYEEDLRL